MRRVVITGLGAITPIGNSTEEMWESVKAGKCGIDKITHYDTTVTEKSSSGERTVRPGADAARLRDSVRRVQSDRPFRTLQRVRISRHCAEPR